MGFEEDAPLAQSFKLKRKPNCKKKLFEVPPVPAVNPPPEIALDYSVESHFKAVDTIAKLCGHSNSLDANHPEIKRLSNSITFLREWRDFKYAPRTVRFANQHNSKDKDVVGEVILHQFSSTSVPMEKAGDDEVSTESSKDFVMFVGGSVWALDWCPCVDPHSENHIKTEFLAVAVHPPQSSYHKIGASLTGRGTIQIWCLLTVDAANSVNKKFKEPPSKPRGRPRKKSRIDNANQNVQPLAKKDSAKIAQIPIDVELPRLVLCLAHNGKVAWDAKWRPVDARRPESMGYLAVLLGNGVLEVWEVPFPHTVKLIFPTSQEHIDPRFVKLKPVFRSSKLGCGDNKQSIPLTMEWSVSSLSDMILAGCHDGVVALWKFSVTDPLTETRPLLLFSAETGPVRTLAWAPIQSDLESANVFATAGQKGLKIWDIRDPFCPLREYPILGGIFGLAWLPQLRRILGVVDDGILWSLNLEKTPHDIPVTGKCLVVASRTSINSFDCSPFSLWCVQASHLTGVVAYCGEEGTAFCFRPYSKSAKDPRRSGTHHYLCGSLMEEGPTLVVATPSTNSTITKKFPGMKNARVAQKEQKENAGASTKFGQGCDNTNASRSKQSDEEVEKHGEIEVFPPKIVAVHRVRWNVNKGSEKWLCYGGAAGLVRCHKVEIS